MITYRATLDVPADALASVSRWLAAHRKRVEARPWQRAATPFVQAVLVLRWFKDATDLRILARDAGVSIATGYQYLHEAIDVSTNRRPGPGRQLSATSNRQAADASVLTARAARVSTALPRKSGPRLGVRVTRWVLGARCAAR